MVVDYAQVAYFALVFVVASAAGISRTLRNGNYRSWSNCFSVGICSGFLGFAIVALAIDHVPIAIGARPVFYLGVSALIGLSGKEHDQIISMFLKRFFRSVRFGEPDKVDDDKN